MEDCQKLVGEKPRERLTLNDVLAFSIIAKNAKSPLPAVIYATEFLNYDRDEAGNTALDDENLDGNCPTELDFVFPWEYI